MIGSISSCIERYPHLTTLIDNPYKLGGNLSARLLSVTEHAVELAKEHALSELNKSHEDLVSGNVARAARARQKKYN